MAKVDDPQLFSFEIERVSVQDFRRHQWRRNLAEKARFPEGSDEARVYLPLHSGNT
jgi:hypothetical protein